MQFWIIHFSDIAGKIEQFEFDNYWDFCVKQNELLEAILDGKFHSDCKIEVSTTRQYHEF